MSTATENQIETTYRSIAKLRPRTVSDRTFMFVVYVLMLLFSLSILYPFWYLLVDSFNTSEASIQDSIKLWPREFTVGNYQEVFDSGIIGTAYVNSIVKTVVGTGVILIVSFLAAFGLADRRLPGIKFFTFFMVFTMFFSGGLIPTYLWYKQLGLLNTRLAWILHLAANAYYIIIMRNFFREIPHELLESAFMDGASLYQILFRIVVPVSAPVVATVTLWAAVQHWNDWFFPLIFTPDRNLTVLQVLLRRVLIENQVTNELDMLAEDQIRMITAEPVKAALLFVSIGPILAVYPFLQRYFVKGIMLGSVKG